MTTLLLDEILGLTADQLRAKATTSSRSSLTRHSSVPAVAADSPETEPAVAEAHPGGSGTTLPSQP